MIAKKYSLLLIILPILMLSLATINIPVQAPLAGQYVKMYVSPTLYPFVAPGGRFSINIYIETNIPNNGPDGIVGWGIYFRCNPASLTIGRITGATAGYYLWQWADWEWLPYPTAYNYIDAPNGFADMSEYISPTPSYGAGNVSQIPYGSDKLVTVDVRVVSDTIPCLLDIYNAEYMIPDGSWRQVDVIVDGYYGAAPGFQSEITGTYNPTQDPVGTTWHELYPNYCHMWNLVEWEDNGDGDLSASDQIVLVNETGWAHPYHVDAVTTTIHWTFKPDEINPTGEIAEAEPDESYPPRVEGFMENPIGSVWHQLYPDYCRQFNITSWIDNTPGEPGIPNGVFDPSDQFDFVYEDEPGVTYWAHLDAVTTDIIISQKGPPYVWPEFPLGLTLMMAIALAIPVAYLWRLRKKVVAK